jgi:predicted O-methyltransferase YrrM
MCFEIDAELAEIARRNIALAGLDDRVTVAVGPATDALRPAARAAARPHSRFAISQTGYSVS